MRFVSAFAYCASLTLVLVLSPCSAQRAKVPVTPVVPSPSPFPPIAPAVSPTALKFTGKYYPSHFTVSLADFLSPNDPNNPDRTGWPSVLGAFNDRNGLFSFVSPDWPTVARNIGLDQLFGSRTWRETLVADFNGDGILDVLANSYTWANDPYSQVELYLGQPDGTFVRDDSNQVLFSTLRGHGENMVVADFNNDGALDVYLPCYTVPATDPRHPDAVHMSLLLNDGSGHFIDATAISELDGNGQPHSVDEAGVGCMFDPNSPYAAVTLDGITTNTPNRYLYWHPEGAQAVDLNQDGKIDLYVGSRMFINHGNKPVTIGDRVWQVPTFTDMSAAYGLVDLNRTNLPANQLFHPDTAAFNQWAANHSYGSAGGPVSYLNAFGPMFFDEGAKFLDWNNDGYLDLVLEDPGWGPALFEFNPQTQKFVWKQWAIVQGRRVPFFNTGPPTYGEVVPRVNGNLIPAPGNDGINAYDLDNDGLEDVLAGGNLTTSQYTNWIFRNMGYGFEWLQSFQTAPAYGSGAVSIFGPVNLEGATCAMAFGDINGDGLIDIVYPQGDGVMAYINKTPIKNRSFVVEVVGPHGEKNQQGRVVTISNSSSRTSPLSPASPIYTRVVDGGSGYMTQNQYGILFALPAISPALGPPTAYRVSVAFADTRFTTTYLLGSLPQDSQNGLRIYAPSAMYPRGRAETFRLHAPAAVPDPPTDTVGVFRPGEYVSYLNTKNDPNLQDLMLGLIRPDGAPDLGVPANGIFPISGDWVGAGTTLPGLYSAPKNTFYLGMTTSGGGGTTTVFKPDLDDIPLAGDWTGQGFETVGVYRRREHTFYLRNSAATGEADIVASPLVPDDNGTLQAPEDNDIPLAGDWNGDHISKVGLYRPRTQIFYLFSSNTSNSGFTATWISDPNQTDDNGVHIPIVFGPDAHPIAGDWNGDGTTKVGIYAGDIASPTVPTFYLGIPVPGEQGMVAHPVAPAFAREGDVPIVGDWDNSGTTSLGVYRAGSSDFILQTATGEVTIAFGDTTYSQGTNFLGLPFIAPVQFGVPFVDVPIIGKWVSGQGSLIGVYRTRTREFGLRNSNAAGPADTSFVYTPNAPTDDIPVVGDWIGQGATTIGVYRASNQTFYLSNANSYLNADTQAQITDYPYTPGNSGIPISGDWDGNGFATIGLYDPDGKAFYLRNSNTIGPYDIKVDLSAIAQAGDIPIAGGWGSSLSGNPLTTGFTMLGLYRPSNSHWLLFSEPIAPNASRVFVPVAVHEFLYGNLGDLPIVGHWSP